ncbi:MAG: glycosyltransferase family 2 protein [Caldilineales bacterium]|nr:glycosyltransferase family 2 protein [Caldilineales bacterium]
MNIGVVIVSYNVRDLLTKCLASVFDESQRFHGGAVRVVVVDNASIDGSADRVAEQFPQAKLIRSGENLGFAAGNNAGLRALGFDGEAQTDEGCDAVLLLNPDAELHPGALTALGGFLEMHPRAGGCCPRLSYGDGSFQHSAFRFPSLAQLLLDFFPLHHRLLDSRLNGRYPRRLYDGDQPFAVDFALGACLLARSDAVRSVGLLDEGYFMYAEEMDWQRRMQDAGWPLYCVPAAHVVHHEGQSARQFRSAMTVALWRSRLRYYDRHYPAWERRIARRIVRLGMSMESRRARQAHDRHQIDAAEFDNRLHAYRQIIAISN